MRDKKNHTDLTLSNPVTGLGKSVALVLYQLSQRQLFEFSVAPILEIGGTIFSLSLQRLVFEDFDIYTTWCHWFCGCDYFPMCQTHL
jgi:hypothetical protein